MVFSNLPQGLQQLVSYSAMILQSAITQQTI